MNFLFSFDVEKLLASFPKSEEEKHGELFAKTRQAVSLINDIREMLKENPESFNDMRKDIDILVASLTTYVLEMVMRRAQNGKIVIGEFMDVKIDMTDMEIFDKFNWDEAGHS